MFACRFVIAWTVFKNKTSRNNKALLSSTIYCRCVIVEHYSDMTALSLIKAVGLISNKNPKSPGGDKGENVAMN